MIVVELEGIKTVYDDLGTHLTSFENDYNSYYNKTEETSDYWVGLIATRFFDDQIDNKFLNKKIFSNIKQYRELIKIIYRVYFYKVCKKNLKIELSSEPTIVSKYEKLDSLLQSAYDLLELEKANGAGIQGAIKGTRSTLKGLKESTQDTFQTVRDNEALIKERASSLDINKVDELDINKYMVN